jgi:hypothetical protein
MTVAPWRLKVTVRVSEVKSAPHSSFPETRMGMDIAIRSLRRFVVSSGMNRSATFGPSL